MLRTSATRRFDVHRCRSSGIPSAIDPASPCLHSARSYGGLQLGREQDNAAAAVRFPRRASGATWLRRLERSEENYTLPRILFRFPRIKGLHAVAIPIGFDTHKDFP